MVLDRIGLGSVTLCMLVMLCSDTLARRRYGAIAPLRPGRILVYLVIGLGNLGGLIATFLISGASLKVDNAFGMAVDVGSFFA